MVYLILKALTKSKGRDDNFIRWYFNWLQVHQGKARNCTCLSVIPTIEFKDDVLYFYHPVAPQVIVGANQNVHFEVNLDYIHQHGIALTRRGAGGGAVYVDPGNLTLQLQR